MGLFSKVMGESKAEKIGRWKTDLVTLLSDSEDYSVDITDDEEIVVQQGSALAIIKFIVNDDDMYLSVDIPLVYLPKHNLLPFYRHLLDHNYGSMCPGRLSTQDDVVFLEATLDTDFITADTLKYTVITMLALGDRLDDELSEEFDTPRWGED